MVSFGAYVVGCLTLITGIMIYLPVVLIRKADKILKTLEQIAARKA